MDQHAGTRVDDDEISTGDSGQSGGSGKDRQEASGGIGAAAKMQIHSPAKSPRE
jgi:hypothetical protein